jgi:hypothetical protein
VSPEKPPEPQREFRPLRVAYAIEALLAFIAFFECWSQIGGQEPLDLMPWWLKLTFAAAFSYAVVKITAATVRTDAFPSVALLRWGLVLFLLLVMVALTTYYFHMLVPPDDQSDEPIPTTFVLPG